jgi:hypothetical protein
MANFINRKKIPKFTNLPKNIIGKKCLMILEVLVLLVFDKDTLSISIWAIRSL